MTSVYFVIIFTDINALIVNFFNVDQHIFMFYLQANILFCLSPVILSIGFYLLYESCQIKRQIILKEDNDI